MTRFNLFVVGLDERRQYSLEEEEDDLLQFAIQQSLIDAGTEKEVVDIWEALKAKKHNHAPFKMQTLFIIQCNFSDSTQR